MKLVAQVIRMRYKRQIKSNLKVSKCHHSKLFVQYLPFKMSNRNPLTLMTVPNEESFDFLFKIVLIGDCGTGKTCVVQRFKNGTFIERHGNTIGVDFSMKTVIVDDKKVKVSLQEVFLKLRFVFF